MKFSLENILSDSLAQSLKILLCTDSGDSVKRIESFLSSFPTFKLYVANSKSLFPQYFDENTSWHCVILDSRCSFATTFIEQIMVRSKWVPIVLLDSKDALGLITDMALEKIDSRLYSYGGHIGKSNGCTVELCDPFSREDLISKLISNSLLKRFFKKIPNLKVSTATNELFISNPTSVAGWAEKIGFSTRKMQRALKNFTLYTPKKLLSLYHAYRLVFALKGKEGNPETNHFKSYNIDNSSKNRFIEYVLTRKSSLLN